MKGNCEICNHEIEIQMCCSGYQCGCMGQPVEPPVCSEECYYKYAIEIHGKDWKPKNPFQEWMQENFYYRRTDGSWWKGFSEKLSGKDLVQKLDEFKKLQDG